MAYPSDLIGSQSYNLLHDATKLVNEGLRDLIKRLYPEVAPVVDKTLTRLDIDALGTRALALLVVLSSYQLDGIQSNEAAKRRFDYLMKQMTTLYILENITDDFCSLSVVGSDIRYEYADLMAHFYTLLEALIEGRMTLKETLMEVSRFPSLYSEMPSVGGLSRMFNIQVDNLLSLHLYSVSDLLRTLLLLEDEYEPLLPLIAKARNGLLYRYHVSRLCLETPRIPVAEALERGKATILTDFHSAFVLLASSCVDSVVRSHTMGQLEALETMIDHSSYIHRILNDTGRAGLQPHEMTQIFADYPPTDTMSPRAYIKYLDGTASEEVKRYLARLIKDVEEHEANIVLDSPYDPELTLAEGLTQNLAVLHRQALVSLTILEDCLPMIQHPYIKGLIPEFIEFERTLYSRLVSEGGEYVDTSEGLLINTLRNVLRAESPMIFVENLLTQSMEK